MTIKMMHFYCHLRTFWAMVAWVTSKLYQNDGWKSEYAESDLGLCDDMGFTIAMDCLYVVQQNGNKIKMKWLQSITIGVWFFQGDNTFPWKNECLIKIVK